MSATNKNKGNQEKKCVYFKITNHEEKYLYKKKNTETEEASNVTEEVIHGKLFIAKEASKKYENETFIPDSGATKHMVTIE